jgi:hypothetical protein
LRRLSEELDVPKTNVWEVLRNRLHHRLYRSQILQQLKPTDKVRRYDFCCNFLGKLANDDTIVNKLVFGDKATFHLSGRVNRNNQRIWGSENPHESFERVRDSPKVIVFAAMSREKLYGPFFFIEPTVTGIVYLDVLREWFNVAAAEGHSRTDLSTRRCPTALP